MIIGDPLTSAQSPLPAIHCSLPADGTLYTGTVCHPAHSSLCKESPAQLMLPTFVRDKTASGTARRKTQTGLHRGSAPCLCMGRDCLWESEEQNREHTFNSIPCVAPRCHRGSLVLYKKGADHLCSLFSVLLLAVPKGVLSHGKVRRISSTRS